MKQSKGKLVTTVLFLVVVSTALAGVHYVDVNSTNAMPPYTNWTTAATNIQDAVDAAVVGDEVLVTNGIYASGGENQTCGLDPPAQFSKNHLPLWRRNPALSLGGQNSPQLENK